MSDARRSYGNRSAPFQPETGGLHGRLSSQPWVLTRFRIVDRQSLLLGKLFFDLLFSGYELVGSVRDQQRDLSIRKHLPGNTVLKPLPQAAFRLRSQHKQIRAKPPHLGDNRVCRNEPLA